MDSLVEDLTDLERHKQNMDRPPLANRPSYEQSLTDQAEALEAEAVARKAGDRDAEIRARAAFLSSLRESGGL